MRFHYRGFRRNPEGIGGGIISTAQGAVSPSVFTRRVVSGAQTAVGFAGVSAVGSVLQRLGLGNVLGAVPDGVFRTLAGYLVKGFQVGVVGLLARAVGADGAFGANIRSGAIANFGVTLVRDASGMLPGGDRIRGFLSGGLGNYFSADGWPAMSGMGDYLNVNMQPTLPPPVYAATDGIYGGSGDIYGGGGSGI